MKLERIFEKFDQLAEAPKAVAKMREIVLQLAVRGNLTEQDDNESSHEQLALAEDFRIRRGKRSEPDSEDVPFVVPTNWGWVAVGDSMNMINGRAFKPEEWTTEGTPIIRIQNLNNDAAPFNYCKIEIDTKIHVHNGDFLISWSGTPGTSFGAFIWNRGFAYLNQHIFRCELVEGVFQKEFLRLAVNARLDEMISHAQGAVGLRHITKGKLEGIRLPLPPLAEQKRIVAKVDELMALCDRLEAQQQERDTRHAALARASLARFAEAPTPANLDFLFHNSYTITPVDLRKTILRLAFAGKLVPQDTNDEPAALLLERARTEKARLVAEGVVKKEPWADDLLEATELYELPLGWEWTHVSDVVEKVTVGFVGSMKQHYRERGVPFLRSQNVRENRFEPIGLTYISEEFHNTIRKSTLRPGDIVVTRSGNVGVTCVIPDILPEANCSDLVVVKSPIALVPAFLSYFINSIASGQIEAKTVGIALTHFNTQSVAQLTVALPPLAEQRRIVAKVDQLMALVDQLETQLTASRATAAKLMEAVVAELTASVPSSPNGSSVTHRTKPVKRAHAH